MYKENLNGNEDAPNCEGGNANEQPGLREMTLKAIDILNNRAGDKGWFIMSEAASVDKMTTATENSADGTLKDEAATTEPIHNEEMLEKLHISGETETPATAVNQTA